MMLDKRERKSRDARQRKRFESRKGEVGRKNEHVVNEPDEGTVQEYSQD